MILRLITLLAITCLLGACGIFANILGSPGLHSEDTYIRCYGESGESVRRSLAIEFCKCTKYSSLGQKIEGPWMEKENLSCTFGDSHTVLNVPGLSSAEVQAVSECVAKDVVFKYDPTQQKAIINGESALKCDVQFRKLASPSHCECR